MTVRLDVSENEWRRHNKGMEPQGRGSVLPLHIWKRNRTLGLRKTTLGVGVHVQPVGLNAETKKDRHRAGRGGLSLDIPFYRTCPISAAISIGPIESVGDIFKLPKPVAIWQRTGRSAHLIWAECNRLALLTGSSSAPEEEIYVNLIASP